jgi:hypothetical protein
LLSAACGGCSRASADISETRTREAAGRAFAIDAGADRMIKVASRADVMFELGFSMISYDPPDDFHNHAFRWMGKNGHVRLHAHGDKNMRLMVGGWVNEKVIRSKPVISLYLDGMLVGTTGAIEGGHWRVERILTPDWFRGREWLNLNVLCNAIAWHWSDPPKLNVIVLYDFEWTEAP